MNTPLTQITVKETDVAQFMGELYNYGIRTYSKYKVSQTTYEYVVELEPDIAIVLKLKYGK